MSDRPIQVGDLVVILNACCNDARSHIGGIHLVSEVSAGGGWNARCCGYKGGGPDARLAYKENLSPLLGWFQQSWLKRIPPLSELEGAVTQETLRKPT